MDKNGLKPNEPSRNVCKGKESGITTAAGTPVYSNEDSMTSGVRGPVALPGCMAHREAGTLRQRGNP